MSELVLFKKIGQVGKITMNRPEKYNSMVKEMAFAMIDSLKTCVDDNEIRAVYITAKGKAFCAGQDLKEATEISLADLINLHFNPLIRAIRNLQKPVVAAVNGIAAGAGANLALACDVVVATESASFIQAFSAIGLIPDSGGTYTLPRLVGYQKGLALAMLGDKVKAPEAEQMGMIYKYFPDEEFIDKSWAIAEKLSQMPTQGLALTKLVFQQSLSNTMEEQLELELKLQVQAGNTADHKEGLAAFLEKRKPAFTGR